MQLGALDSRCSGGFDQSGTALGLDRRIARAWGPFTGSVIVLAQRRPDVHGRPDSARRAGVTSRTHPGTSVMAFHVLPDTTADDGQGPPCPCRHGPPFSHREPLRIADIGWRCGTERHERHSVINAHNTAILAATLNRPQRHRERHQRHPHSASGSFSSARSLGSQQSRLRVRGPGQCGAALSRVWSGQ